MLCWSSQHVLLMINSSAGPRVGTDGVFGMSGERSPLEPTTRRNDASSKPGWSGNQAALVEWFGGSARCGTLDS